jgi:hypothetical protein
MSANIWRDSGLGHLERDVANGADIQLRHSRSPLQVAASGHFDPFPPPRLNGRCLFRRYVLVPWSAARPDGQ